MKSILILSLFLSLTCYAGNVNNWGLTVLEVDKALRLHTAQSTISVAVIDTGVDLTGDFIRPDGWNYSENNSNTMDTVGHGTHITGIIHSVAPTAEILPIKYYSQSAPDGINLLNTVKSIRYAISHGIKVINYSSGGHDFNEDEYLAIKEAGEKGIIFVTAAGNNHEDIDKIDNYFYPAAYKLPNVISVAASTVSGDLSYSSNWGLNNVFIAAPGQDIYSNLPGEKYGYMSGTSQATAFVSGVVALMLSVNPVLTPKDVKRELMLSTVETESLKDKVKTGGVINAFRVISSLQKMCTLNKCPLYIR